MIQTSELADKAFEAAIVTKLKDIKENVLTINEKKEVKCNKKNQMKSLKPETTISEIKLTPMGQTSD
jgi:hypothetical protein